MKNKLEELVFGVQISSSPVLAFYFLSSDIEDKAFLKDTCYLLDDGYESEIRPVDYQTTYLIVYIRESSFQNWDAINKEIGKLQNLICAKIHKVEFVAGRFKALSH